MASGFRTIASTDSSNAAIANDKNVYALQFHPEVYHSEYGIKMIENFVFNICKCEKNWKMTDLITRKIADIKDQTKGEKVLLGLSGGVDSSVCAALLNKAIGKDLICVFVDTGLLRKNEKENVEKQYEIFDNMNIVYVDAKNRFLEKLKGITDPEQKRKIIGKEFVDIFNEQAQILKKIMILNF